MTKQASQIDPVVEKLIQNSQNIKVLEAQLQALNTQILEMKKFFSSGGAPKASKSQLRKEKNGKKQKGSTLKDALSRGSSAVPNQAQDAEQGEGFYKTAGQQMKMRRNDTSSMIINQMISFMQKSQKEKIKQFHATKKFDKISHTSEKLFYKKLLEEFKKLKGKTKKKPTDKKEQIVVKKDGKKPQIRTSRQPSGASTTTPSTGSPSPSGPTAVRLPPSAPAQTDAGYAARAVSVAGGISKVGLTNPISVQAFLQVASKESGLKQSSSELGAQAWANTIAYKNAKEGPGAGVAYANATFHRNFTEQQYLDAAAKGDEYFFGPNFMNQYGGGWKYRGRGYIGLTHDFNYKKVGELIGKDLISDPDLIIRDPEVNAQASVAVLALSIGQGDYNKGLKILNSFDDKQKALTFMAANVASGGTGLNEGRVAELMKTQHFQNALTKAQSFEGAVSSALSSTKFGLPGSSLPVPTTGEGMTAEQLKLLGLNLRSTGDVHKSGSYVDPNTIEMARKIQSAIPEFSMITAVNDEHHQKELKNSAHTKGTAIDFVVKGTPTRERAAEIKSILNSMGFIAADEYYADVTKHTTGPHFHVELKPGASLATMPKTDATQKLEKASVANKDMKATSSKNVVVVNNSTTVVNNSQNKNVAVVERKEGDIKPLHMGQN